MTSTRCRGKVLVTMPLLLQIALDGIVLVLLVPTAVFVLEGLLALLPGGRKAEPPAVQQSLRTTVLMPAHDEEEGIGAALDSVTGQLGPQDSCLVVADNCTDRTAEIARAAGATVVERSHPTDRGKGFALAFGLDQLASDPPHVVIIADADCRFSPGSLDRLARLAFASGRPVQADYLLVAPLAPSPMAIVGAFAFLVRNRVRPLGLARLGLPCHLTGTGMAFRWDVIRKAPPTRDHLTEDLVMGLDLALRGHAPMYYGGAEVTSVLPTRDRAAKKQRTRWEHGQLTVAATYGPRLLLNGISKAQLGLIALGLDLLVPPLALLVLLLGVALMLTFAVALAEDAWWVAATVALATAAVALTVLGGWWKFARETTPLRSLLLAPLYVFWKIPLYLSYLIRGRHKTWDRTER